MRNSLIEHSDHLQWHHTELLSHRPSELETAATPQAAPSVYKFFFNIGSIDSFERKMEEAQDEIGVRAGDHVPIIYTNELSWQQARQV